MIKTRYKKLSEGGSGISVKLNGSFGMIFEEIAAIIEETDKAINTFISDEESRTGARMDMVDRIDNKTKEIKRQLTQEAIEKEKDLPEEQRKLTIAYRMLLEAKERYREELAEIEKKALEMDRDARQAAADDGQADISEIEFAMRMEQEKEKE